MGAVDIEIKLLNAKSISRQEIELELSAEENEPGNEDEFNSRVTRAFKEYKELVTIFNNRVFVYDKYNKAVKVSEAFCAKEEYMLCLAKMNRSILDDGALSNLFEDIVGEALTHYLGEGARYKRIDDDTEKNNIDFVSFCKNALCEEPHPNAKKNFKNDSAMPKRTDIVVWKPIDCHSGKIILLVQCKTGTRWRKGLAVNIDVWKSRLVMFGADPVRVFATADRVSSRQECGDRYTEKGLVLDRARIISLLANAESDTLTKLRQKISTHKLHSKLQKA